MPEKPDIVRKGDAAAEFRKNNKNEVRERAKKRTPPPKPEEINQVPRLEKELKKRQSIIRIFPKKRRSGYQSDYSACDQVNQYLYKKMKRRRLNEERWRPDPEERVFRPYVRAGGSVLPAYRLFRYSIDSFHDPMPAQTQSDVFLDSDASSIRTIESDNREPLV